MDIGHIELRDQAMNTIHASKTLMFTQITNIIRASHGYVYESAGILNGFFDDPDLARQCAALLRHQFECQVQLCGCELSVSRLSWSNDI